MNYDRIHNGSTATIPLQEYLSLVARLEALERELVAAEEAMGELNRGDPTDFDDARNRIRNFFGMRRVS